MKNNTTNAASISSITDSLPDNYNLTSASIKVGNSPAVTLLGTDYTLSSNNLLNVISVAGSSITVPANGSTVLTLTGNFS